MSNQASDLVTYALQGVWTPWAKVLCVECDYYGLTEGENKHRLAVYREHVAQLEGMRRTELVAKGEYEEYALCDSCGSGCWVRFDVAVCQWIGRTLSWPRDKRALDQTGGMCCALVIDAFDHEIVVTAMDGGICVGEYVKVGEDEDRWNDPLRTYEHTFATIDGEFVDVDRAVAVVVGIIHEWIVNPVKP